MRLDVHPRTGDIVFDMLGDVYCLPASAYSSSGSQDRTKALPVLTGIPYDSDPRFSPDGKRLVYRSDAELGVENIWVMEWKGCVKHSAEAEHALTRLMEEDQQLLAQGIPEVPERTTRRLLREGRDSAIRITNETYRWVSDARFHPSGKKIIATKWYTSDRSIPAGEGWEYEVPSSKTEIQAGSGQRVVGRTLPRGWDIEEYGELQVGPEQFIWNGEGGLIYAKNVIDESEFNYSKDVHSGIYSIFARNLTTNATETLVSSFPGGASRPELSRDGRTLAFVTRVRDKEALVLKDLVSGTIHQIWYGLTYDLTTISAPMGTYPSFSFTADDSAIIIWAAGQIWNVPLGRNAFGERVSSSSASPQPIPFIANIHLQLADTRTEQYDLTAVESADTQRARAFKELSADHTGKRVVFTAGSRTYHHLVGDRSNPQPVPSLRKDRAYYSPSFISNDKGPLVIQARWDDTSFSAIEIADINAKVAHELNGIPRGRYYAPVLCSCKGTKRSLAFVKLPGDLLTGNVVATALPGLYLADIDLPDIPVSQSIKVKNLRFVPSEISTGDHLRLRFEDGNKTLMVAQSHRTFSIDLSASPDAAGKYPHKTIAEGRMSSETSLSPGRETFAMVEFYQVQLIATKKVKADEAVWSKPGNATEGLVRASLHGGHDVAFSGDGKTVFWFLGPHLHSLEVSKLHQCTGKTHKDPSGFNCIHPFVRFQELEVHHSTDIARLRRDAAATGSNTLIVYNVTALDMEPTSGETARPGILTVKDGVIKSFFSVQEDVARVMEEGVSNGYTLIDGLGAYVVPGFIDVHAHWGGFGVRLPAKSWEMETFLAHGVTTLHNPSADNVAAFVERTRIESGQMIGPRIFSVGGVIYGAADEQLHQPIVDMATAEAALVRIKVEGGPAAISYKNYQLSSRAYRQRLLLKAREPKLRMLCVPEGGMNYDWDMTFIIDGMTTVEHSIPVPVLYDDVKTLFAESGTGNTPTHVVNYGGAFGEQLVWATEDIPNDPKLRTFNRHDELLGVTESTARPMHSYSLFNTSTSVADMVHRGLKAHIGAHGEPPLGLNYHEEMVFAKVGGLTNYEVLRAATYDAALTLGLASSIGSLAPGKLADFLVYHPEVDLLNGPITGTREIRYVVRGGRMWDVEEGMVEVWPVKGRRQVLPPFNAD